MKEKIQELERQIAALPIGYISKKTINGKTRLLSSVDRKWEEAQPISAGWRTGAAAGANRAAQSIAGTAERAASQDAQSAPAKVGL